MIIQNIYLEKYDWAVRVYYEVEHLYINSITRDLIDLSCKDPEGIIGRFLEAGLNAGFTYTSPSDRGSIVVIGRTTEPAEFQSTFDHEKGHLATHIAEIDNIDLYSEDYQYLVGEIGKKMFSVARLFMCNCQENKLLYKLEGKEVV